MIYIDYQGGAHGNYLDFVCNKYLAGIPCNDSPFIDLGAAHNKGYRAERKFKNGHYSDYQGVRTELYDSKIVSIQITEDDMLPLQSVGLLRVGNYNIDPDQLEIGTYHKLNNPSYRDLLDNIIQNFFATQIQDSYEAIKDPSWPQVSCLADFFQLPDWIQQECIQVHDLRLMQLDQDHADCPRHVLREFFKIGFKNPELSGSMQIQKKMIYNPGNDVLIFPFACFYDTEQFMSQIRRIAEWSQFDLKNEQDLRQLHLEFLKRQPFKFSKPFCDQIVDRILNGEHFDFPKLDLMQESYIWAKLEQHLGQTLPVNQDKWFANSRELSDLMLK